MMSILISLRKKQGRGYLANNKYNLIRNVAMACIFTGIALFSMIGISMADNAVKIISPSNNEKFSPGQEVHVKVQAPEDSTIMIVAGPYDSALLSKSPYEFTFTIPQDTALGKVGITAGGGMGANDFAGSDEVSIMVGMKDDAKNDITEILMLPDENPVYLWYHSAESGKPKMVVPLNVYATFTDGARREITNLESGTSYKSSDESVFAVGEQYGQISIWPVSIGKAYLTVTHGPFSKVSEVIVKESD